MPKSSTKKRCFVIMPYGGSSDLEKKKYLGIYRSIIKPAIEDAGYQAVREDVEATPGQITRNIVEKLATCEMVVADLSAMNPNVSYELGIRHVLSKSATVLIARDGEKVPFDNAAHKVIFYTEDLASLDDARAQITDAIRKREENAERSDNLVHDNIPQLPANLYQFLNSAGVNDEVQKLTQRNGELASENQRLRKILEENGVLREGASVRDTRSIREIMAEAQNAIGYTGRQVTIQLRNYAAANNTDGFIQYLETAMEAGYLDENDYIQIQDVCENFGYLPLERAVMERAMDLFPKSETIIRVMSDVYTRMPLQKDKLKGVGMMEELLAIKEVDGRYVLTDGTLPSIERNNLAALFNAYQRLDFYDRTISVCESYDELNLPMMPLVIRNKADALSERNQAAKARETYEYLLQVDYNDDANHAFYASFLSEIREYVKAYQEREIAIQLDLNDPQRFVQLGIEIINYGYVRKSPELIAFLDPGENRFDYVMPIFQHALSISNYMGTIKARILDVLMRRNQMSYAQAVMNNGVGLDESSFQTYPLDYVLTARITPNRK